MNTGAPQDANDTPVPKADADRAFDAATCIGCAAGAAACPTSRRCCPPRPRSPIWRCCRRASRTLVAGQGHAPQHDIEGFGNCTNIGECAAVCPKEIPLDTISQLNRDLMHSLFKKDARATPEQPSRGTVGRTGRDPRSGSAPRFRPGGAMADLIFGAERPARGRRPHSRFWIATTRSPVAPARKFRR